MNVSRRQFLAHTLRGCGAAWLASGCAHLPQETNNLRVMTVSGPIGPKQMGYTLPHEHLLVDFRGAQTASTARYNREEIMAVALPYLEQARNLGCQTFVDCTPAFLGRDPVLLRQLAVKSRLHILTNTGYYGAGENKFLPSFAFEESAAQLANRWTAEFRHGIDHSRVKPGFIKIGVAAGKLSDLHRKLVEAAALTHRATGLTIAAHTGNGLAALDELDVLVEKGVRPEAFIWVHAQSESDKSLHRRAASLGAFIEFDGLSAQTIDQHLDLVMALEKEGMLGRVLVSHDAGWYHAGEVRGGNFRSYEILFTRFIPKLKAAGWTARQLDQLLIDNPRAAFTIQSRLL